jgi:hypothetical protein
MNEKPRVFIAYTGDTAEIAESLKMALSVTSDPVTIRDVPSLGFTRIESLIAEIDRADFAIVVLGEGARRHYQARENIFLELGILMGKLGPSRVLLLAPDMSGIHIPSDLSGIATIRYQPFTHPDALDPAITMIRNAITHRPSSPTPVEYYSCFLSHSAQDKDFVSQLSSDLQEAGVNCWLDSQQLRVGDSLIETIQEGISRMDRVLLVLSQAGLSSQWMRREINVALQREVRGDRTLLFPLTIDDAVFQTSEPVFARLVSAKHIADFSKWHDREAYHRAFSRLVRDLTVTLAVESKESV